jgi:hypothetical protein
MPLTIQTVGVGTVAEDGTGDTARDGMVKVNDNFTATKTLLDTVEGTANGAVQKDGTTALTADWDAGSFEIRAQTFESDVITGTAPLVVASTTVVTNLNADLLDGNHAAAFALAGTENATHTGQVTGSGALTVQPAAISEQSSVTVASGDQLLILDVSDSPNTLKRIPASDFATAAHAHEGTAILSTGETGAVKFLREDGDNTSSWQTITQNATHTGDAAGATALTLQPAAVTGKGAVTVASADVMLLVDASASPQVLGKTTAQEVADLSKPIETFVIACSDETTALTTGTAKVTFRMPYAFTLSEVRASVTTAPTGSSIIVDINEKVGTPSPNVGTSILSTKLYIDVSEFSSEDASASPAHQSVISDTSLADDAQITIDVDQIGSTIAGAGLKVYLIGRRT